MILGMQQARHHRRQLALGLLNQHGQGAEGRGIASGGA
jgi:hypothetical protein